MGKGKKLFIDRKKAVTFHLVHRSQHDPLVTDETAPQHVLVEASKNKGVTSADPNKRIEEQKKFGILYDDDYDYLQHLKKPEQEIVWEYVENPNQAKKRVEEGNLTTAPKLQLPSSVFASQFEEEEGMLNKAALCPGPRPDWDPDVVAALDNDFDFDNEANELDDDFVLQAMGDDNESENEQDMNGEDDESDVDSDDLMESNDDFEENETELMDRLAPLLRERRFPDEETKSRFTEYSMSSSVIRRNEQLSLLDDRFEKFFASYDDPELGDLGMEEIEGGWHQKHPYVLGCFKEFKKSKKLEEYNKDWDKERIEKYRNIVDGEDPNEEIIECEVENPKEKKWDCESILSTYSNIYNHPKLINEPRRRQKIEIDSKTGLPSNVLRNGESQLTAKALSMLDETALDHGSTGAKSLCAKSVMSTLSVLSLRPKDETSEEKKERKRLLREYRTERRIERKANTEAFKEEKKRQTHIKLNQSNNLQGNKIM